MSSNIAEDSTQTESLDKNFIVKNMQCSTSSSDCASKRSSRIHSIRNMQLFGKKMLNAKSYSDNGNKLSSSEREKKLQTNKSKMLHFLKQNSATKYIMGNVISKFELYSERVSSRRKSKRKKIQTIKTKSPCGKTAARTPTTNSESKKQTTNIVNQESEGNFVEAISQCKYGCRTKSKRNTPESLLKSPEKISGSKSNKGLNSRSLRQSVKVKKDLKEHVYYHGFRPRKDVVALLKEPGDFLLRATDANGRPEILISVLNDKRELINVIIKRVNKKYQLQMVRKSTKVIPEFVELHQLIQHYKKHHLPGHAKLRRGIPRPSWLIKNEDVIFDRTKDLLGSGNFCDVYKGTYSRAGDVNVVAIKICHQSNESDKNAIDANAARDRMIEEAQMMSYYVHNHIVQMYGLACDRSPVLIVMEYCPGGNLGDHLQNQKESIEVGERVMYALEASRGMQYLHRKNCIHRDLAARNCLISAKGRIKIADFGLSKRTAKLEKMNEVIEDEPSAQIPVRWMAPESLHRPMKFSPKSDVWSFGVLLYEIFNQGEKPWPNETFKKVAHMIRRCQMPKLPDNTPKEINDILTRIWVMNPDDRPTMKELYSYFVTISDIYKPPSPDKFALNRLEGVHRVNPETLYSLVSMLFLSSR